MTPFRTLFGAAVGIAVVAMASADTQVRAQAQRYPTKPVTIISDSAAGSTPDAVLRVIADRLSRFWGQQILAVHQPADAIAFVQAEQQKWKPVLELIASKAK